MRRFAAVLALLFAAVSVRGEEAFDVVVYGGTAAGTIAAIAAAEDGAAVVLIEPGAHIGGMVSGGLGRTDIGRHEVIGAMARQYFTRVGAHYGRALEWYVEPYVAERIFRQWLAEAKVNLRFGQRVASVVKNGTRIVSATMESGEAYVAPVFIDASYEGDLMARAGVAYTVGRESRAHYGESLAGVIAFSEKHQFLAPVDPHEPGGALLPLVSAEPLAEPGSGDKKVQAYNFRLCLTQVPENRVRFPKPEGYDPAEYELLRRYLAAKPGLAVGDILNPLSVNNGKTDANNNGPFSTDVIGESWDYPEASYEERERIVEHHKRYTLGFLYFLANDPSVPKALQDEINTWGFAKDEFADNGNFPRQIYVREARRMIGAYVMIQKDLQDERTKPDSIGMGSYNSDSHHVQRVVAENVPGFPEGKWVINEGDMQVPVQPYEIAYRALTPKPAECENLLVVCAVSASHVAYSSIRMEPQYMIMGEAAGRAAVMALRAETPVQSIDVPALQNALRENSAVLSLAEAVGPLMRVTDLPGIALDNDGAELAGEWRASQSTVPYVGLDYAHTLEGASPETAARYAARIPESGRYTVRVYYSPHPNRARNAKIVVQHAEGTAEFRIDQRTFPADGQPYRELGPFPFQAGAEVALAILNDDPQGFLIADAVAWVPAG